MCLLAAPISVLNIVLVTKLNQGPSGNRLPGPATEPTMTATLTAQKQAKRLSQDSIDQLFHQARTHNGFRSKPVPRALLEDLYDLVRMGPTSANGSHGRFI